MIKLSITPIYYISIILPFVSVIVCWIFYYSMHNKYDGRIKTISETVLYFPETRIFGVGLSIESVFVFVLILIRNTVASDLSVKKNIRFPTLQLFMKIGLIAIPLGIFSLCTITLLDNAPIHLTGAFFFFIGSIIYFTISDYVLRKLGMNISLLSFSVSWLALGFAILYMTLMSMQKFLSAGAIFQYITSLLIFVKLFLFQYDIPNHNVQITKNNKE